MPALCGRGTACLGICPRQGTHCSKRVGRRRGMLISGGEVDTERAAAMLLDEFRAGRLGRVTLELPPEDGETKG